MTYSLKITPSAAAILDGYCRAAGQSLKTVLGVHLTQQAPAAPTRVADHAAATLAAASAEQPLPAAAAPAEPAAEPQPMAPEAEDALLSLLGA